MSATRPQASGADEGDADWPEWVQVSDREIIHFAKIKHVYFCSDGTIGMDMVDSEWSIVLADEAAAKFKAWWEARKQRDDVAVL